MCQRRQEGEKSLLKTEKKIHELQGDLPLSQFSMVKNRITLEFLTHL